MRTLVFAPVFALVPALALTLGGSAGAAAAADPQALEQAWHRCVREAFAHQPPHQSRAGNERNALDECKDREDAYVASLMADRPAAGWARTWAALVEPLAAWVGLNRR